MYFRPKRRKNGHRKSETKSHRRIDIAARRRRENIQWNEILRGILNGKLKIIKNRTREFESEPDARNFHDVKEKSRRGECHTVKYRVRIIRFNEVSIKLEKNIHQPTIIVPLFVHTNIYTYVY